MNDQEDRTVHISNVSTLTEYEREEMKRSFVVSIDIGTSRTGFSILPPNVGPGDGPDFCYSIDDMPDAKGPSDVVFTGIGSFPLNESWVGSKAIEKARENPDGCTHFKHYKRDLFANDGNPDIYCVSTASNGCVVQTSRIFAACLYNLKKIIKAHLSDLENNKGLANEATVKPYTDIKTNIYFVILLPAIAKSNYYKVMENAVVESTLIPRKFVNTNVKFMEEPISASLYMSQINELAGLSVGMCALVIDSGGGTTDYIGLKFTDLVANNIERRRLPGGDYKGSTNVNMRLIDDTARLITKGRYGPRIFDSEPGVTIGLNEAIERIKIAVDLGADGAVGNDFVFDLSWMSEKFKRRIGFDGEKLKTYVEMANSMSTKVKPWKYERNTLYIRRDYVVGIIREIASKVGTDIEEYITKGIMEGESVYSSVILVGGFSTSKIFQSEIRNRVHRLALLERSKKGDVAVVIGGSFAVCLNRTQQDNTESTYVGSSM